MGEGLLRKSTFLPFHDSTNKNNNNNNNKTEGLLFAAQDQALRTNSVKSRIDKQDVSPSCRMCGEREETVGHIVAECKMFAQKYYKNWRHDKVAQMVHWRLCKSYGLERGDVWYKHEPKPVIENEQTKVLWDLSIQRDHPIEANRPDIVVLEKTSRKCLLIDTAFPFETIVANKEKEKVEKHQDLRRELHRIWKCSDVKIIPVIIGALGTLPKCLPKWLRELNMTCDIELLQKVCLLGSARILRGVLDM